MARVSKEVADKVYKRDSYRCVHCGTTGGLSIQHRKNAGMGGSKKAHSASNLAVLCLLANQRLESDAEFARVGRFYGWKLKSYENPLNEPVYDMNTNEWYLLDDAGGRRSVSPVRGVEETVPF